MRIVAVNHDTSIVIMERTYSRDIGDHADALARTALPRRPAKPSGAVLGGGDASLVTLSDPGRPTCFKGSARNPERCCDLPRLPNPTSPPSGP